MPTVPIQEIISRVQRRPQPERMYFRCPECACTDLEEVARCMQYSTIGVFYRYSDGQRYYPDWFDSDYDDHTTLRVQCRDCGFEVSNGMPNDLFQHCSDNGWVIPESEVQTSPLFDARTPSSSQDPSWEV